MSTAQVTYEDTAPSVETNNRNADQVALALNLTSPPLQVSNDNETVEEKSLRSPWILGAPTQSFRDNLHADRKYISSWLAAGWSTSFDTFILSVHTDQYGHLLPLKQTTT